MRPPPERAGWLHGDVQLGLVQFGVLNLGPRQHNCCCGRAGTGSTESPTVQHMELLVQGPVPLSVVVSTAQNNPRAFGMQACWIAPCQALGGIHAL